MDAAINLLIETFVAIVFDPVVLGGTVIVSLALYSGLVAYVFETVETRLHCRPATADERPATSPDRG